MLSASEHHLLPRLVPTRRDSRGVGPLLLRAVLLGETWL